MTNSFDFGKALTYMFEDPDWVKKFLIAVLVAFFSIFIIPAFMIVGYQVAIMRNVMRGAQTLLPEWEGKWMDYLRDGFLAAVAQFVYMLPVILLAFCGIVPLALGTSNSDSGEMSGPAVLLLCCLLLVFITFAILASLVYYVGMVRFAETGDIGAFFKLGELIKIARTRTSLLVMAFLASAGAGLVGGFVPVVGTVWAYLVGAHAMGQVGRNLAPGRSPTESPLA